ncbi:MAG: NUDIX domain-containing protein [Singulisphaera sp.]
MVTEPKRAAACVLVRGQNEPEVLLVQRNNTLRFMAGHHVFPGGRLQEDENASAVVNAASPEMAQTVLAVAREVFEETGLLCVRDRPPA